MKKRDRIPNGSPGSTHAVRAHKSACTSGRPAYEPADVEAEITAFFDDYLGSIVGGDPDAVLTTGIIGWLDEAESTDTLWITYTGVSIRTEDGWGIIHEHESSNTGPGG